MRLSNKVVEEAIKEIAGEDVLLLVKIIKNKKNVSEFKIAEKANLSVNIIRNMLYRLYHANLVSFIRKKDKKKGWYIYYWTFNMKRIGFLYDEIKKKKLEKLRIRLDREKSNFFFACKNTCMRLDLDRASEYGFKCPECGELLEQEDNSAMIKGIEKDIKDIGKN
jgi:transcription initiation factor TFIIE subunit alpha